MSRTTSWEVPAALARILSWEAYVDLTPRRSVALRLVVISVGVVITLLLSFLLLVVLNLVVDALYPVANDGPAYADPDAPGVPVTGLRLGFALALVVLYPLLVRTRLSETLKAVLLSAPVGSAAAAAGVTLYDRPAVAWFAMGAVALATAMLLRAARLPWPYYVSATIALVLATAYALPSL
jgi:hypothetical protein